MGGKIKKAMGAQWAPPPEIWILSEKVIPEVRWAYNFSIKWKNKRKLMGNLPMLFCVSNGASRKKNNGCFKKKNDGRGAHEIKKKKAPQQKNDGQRPFFENPFFMRP